MLFLCRELGMDNAFKAIEYGGDTVEGLSMAERMVLCNMAAELGCEAGVVAPDRTTFAYLRAVGRPVEMRRRLWRWRRTAMPPTPPFIASMRRRCSPRSPRRMIRRALRT